MCISREGIFFMSMEHAKQFLEKFDTDISFASTFENLHGSKLDQKLSEHGFNFSAEEISDVAFPENKIGIPCLIS
jgi:hypothetical protein